MTSLLNQIAAILQLKVNNSWEIQDSDSRNGLYLIHHSSDANMAQYGSLRGVVVDVPGKSIVSRSIGYTPIVSTSEIQVRSEDGRIHLRDRTYPDLTYLVDPLTTRLYPGFDGVVMNVFLHHGQVYHATDKHLDGSKFRSGRSRLTLSQLYDQLGGPNPNELFDLTKQYSPIVHRFILADPSLQMASQVQVGAGYLIYLGPQQIWDPETSEYPVEQIDMSISSIQLDSKLIENPSTPLRYQPEPLSIEAANRYLQDGLVSQSLDPSDPRLGRGEFILAYIEDTQGMVTGAIRIESPAYQWRASMQDGYSNLEYQFYLQANGKFIRGEYENERQVYLDKFPILLGDPETTMTDLNRRLDNIFLAYLSALPESIRSSQENLLDTYRYHLNELIPNWLIDLHYNDDLGHLVIPSRAKQIIRRARQDSRDHLIRDSSQDLDPLVVDRIRDLVLQEEGGSLYHLAKAAKLAAESEEANVPLMYPDSAIGTS